MTDTPGQTQSLLDIVRGVERRRIMLPEFQRDFRWELDQTHDLFDSLIRDIFIGSVIYGKPSFGLTLREIDRRPRRGTGSRGKLALEHYDDDRMHQEAELGLRIVLDGQQRITSIYRALVGADRDHVYLHLKPNLDPDALPNAKLEDLYERVSGEDRADRISIRFADAYDIEAKNYEDDDLNTLFARTSHAKALGDVDEMGSELYRRSQKVYRRTARKLLDLFKQQKLVTFHLLDMNLDKFCAFFERSNSRGIQLNFTDILAAKLYGGFNLRQKIQEFEDELDGKVNRELMVRSIALLRGMNKLDKQQILQELTADDFNTHWDTACRLYQSVLEYLRSERFVITTPWMPYENMMLPLMVFLSERGNFSAMTEVERRFLAWWYWASVFSTRYSAASNEIIKEDAERLRALGRGEQSLPATYFARFRPVVERPDDFFSYTRSGGAVYRGALNLLHYASRDGLRDWNNNGPITSGKQPEDHHIYPRAYVGACTDLDLPAGEAAELAESVVNRALMPKLTNVAVGKQSPHTYLKALQKKNSNLDASLDSHAVPIDVSKDVEYDRKFRAFLEERAQKMFDLMDQQAVQPLEELRRLFGQGDSVGP